MSVEEVMGSGDGGRCFEAALFLAPEIANSLICHGRPIGRGPLNGGQRYWHAWVEAPSGKGWDVIDGSLWAKTEGKHAVLVIPRPNYYRIGQIEGDKVLRFGPAAAKAAIRKYDHLGPWVDDEELESAL